MGSLIVRQVISDLIPLGLGRSHGGELLLAGSSAGGLGVMLNLDKVKRYLRRERGIKLSVRGVSDSGWFLDREPYMPNAIGTVDVVKQGWKFWSGALPDACVARHSTEPWRCYFGHRIYPTLKCKQIIEKKEMKSNKKKLLIQFSVKLTASLFVFQWLFDEAQMSADNVGAPVTPQQWDYIHEMGGALRSSLDNVTAVFAPSCIGHAVLTKRDWMNIKIDDISLVDALRCWERSTRKHKGKGRKRHIAAEKEIPTEITAINSNTNTTISHRKRHRLTPEERKRRRQNMTEEERTRRRHQRLKKMQKNEIEQNENRNQRQKKPNRKLTSDERNNRNNQSDINRRNGQNNGNKRKRNKLESDRDRRVTRNRKFIDPKRCSLRLIERCSWPQCNHSCPALRNPRTGEEMRFLELLASFGLDIEAVATALGIDMQTLNNMDHAELVNLLTQQVN